MKFLAKKAIQPPRPNETVCRISPWGTLFAFVIFLAALCIGFGLLVVFGFYSPSLLGIFFAGCYTLLVGMVCRLFYRTLRANRSPANWVARIGPAGMLIKYRSYLHDDLPADDPIALQLSWPEIADAQLLREYHTQTDSDGTSRVRRWFLVLRLNTRYVDADRVSAALEFEHQRKPAHFAVDDLKHQLFLARKNKAPAGDIDALKREIAAETRRHPGNHAKTRALDRPVVLVKPDQLKMEWTHVLPSPKRLRVLLARHIGVADAEQTLDLTKPMPDAAFHDTLNTLISRGEKIEAIKLVRVQNKLGLAAAKAFVEQVEQETGRKA
jgi:hypothetical protein